MNELPIDQRLPLVSLRLFRVQPGEQCFCRTLTPAWKDTVAGLYTHFSQGRSRYCQGEHCPPAYHRAMVLWKGYAACEVWEPKIKVWRPVVLEVTEFLELAMRGVYARGQVWEIGRDAQTARRKTPVWGRLLETHDETTFPHAHDVLPVLLRLYHEREIVLDKVNPVPMVDKVQYSKGPPPRGQESTQKEEKPATQEQLDSFRKRFRNDFEGIGNGKNVG